MTDVTVAKNVMTLWFNMQSGQRFPLYYVTSYTIKSRGTKLSSIEVKHDERYLSEGRCPSLILSTLDLERVEGITVESHPLPASNVVADTGGPHEIWI